jgi:hypothetical protein
MWYDNERRIKKLFEVTREQVTSMQDKQITNIHEYRSQHLSSDERYFAVKNKEAYQTIPNPSSEEIEKFILTLPAPYREKAIQAIAQRYINAMKLHVLQLVTIFCEQAEKEGISEKYLDESLQNIEDEVDEIMTLDQRLKIDSVEKLYWLGLIAANLSSLSHFRSAEETESSLYAIYGLYQGMLERKHLLNKEQSE